MLDVSRRISGYIPKGRERVLTDDEIQWLWELEHDNARVLQVLILTGLRISEAQKGLLEKDRWLVPGEVSKNGWPHWTYLTKTAQTQLPVPPGSRVSFTNLLIYTKKCRSQRSAPVDMLPI